MKLTNLVFSLSLLAQVCLAQGDHSQNTIPQITLGAEDDWFPYCGEFHKVNHGIGPDIVRAAYAAVGVKVDYQAYPLARCFAEVKAGKLVGCLESIRDASVENDYVWHQVPLYESTLKIYARKNNPLTSVTIPDLERAVLGVTVGYEYGPDIDQNNKIKKESARTDIQNLEKLAAGRIEFFPIYDRVYDYLIAVNPHLNGKLKPVATLFTTKLFVPFSKNSADSQKLTQLLDAGLQKIRKSGQYKAIMAKWQDPKLLAQFKK
jgi:polar amino acid transport system substrate-binding protein